MNASRTDSRANATFAGSPDDGTTSESGAGSIHTASVSGGGSGRSACEAGSRSIGRARRWREPSMSRQTLVAMRYSHERSWERPSNRSRDFQARTMVSCTASSASKAEPSMR
jgi:hypothetical protein